MINKIIISLLVTCVVIMGISSFQIGFKSGVNETKNTVKDSVGFINGGSNASLCNVATSTTLVVGKDIATFLAATSSRRAYLKIEVGPNASSTIALNFNGAIASSTTNTTQYYGALIGLGALANSAITNGGVMATSTSEFVAGLSTNNPYVGAVSAMALSATSTAFVTECIYNN